MIAGVFLERLVFIFIPIGAMLLVVGVGIARNGSYGRKLPTVALSFHSVWFFLKTVAYLSSLLVVAVAFVDSLGRYATGYTVLAFLSAVGVSACGAFVSNTARSVHNNEVFGFRKFAVLSMPMDACSAQHFALMFHSVVPLVVLVFVELVNFLVVLMWKPYNANRGILPVR